MERVLEPELMDELGQAEAYTNADFEEPHSRVIELFDSKFPGTQIKGHILDLGCGSGDITFRFAYRFPQSKILGVDGSAAMIKIANERKVREAEVGERVIFIEGIISGVPIPKVQYDAIVSNSLLHHLHRPEVLWETIIEYASPGTMIFIVDLFRPGSKERAEQIVCQYSGTEPEILKRDFYNSLLAAFEPAEVEVQLYKAGLSELSVRVISDRHLIVYGWKANK